MTQLKIHDLFGTTGNSANDALFGIPGSAGSVSLGNTPRRGTKELLLAYSQLPWLRAITRRVADATASIEWQAFEDVSRSRPMASRISRIQGPARTKAIREAVKAADMRPVERADILDVLEGGNDFLDGRSIRMVSQVNFDLAGEAFILIDSDGLRIPRELWPIPPHWVTRAPRPGGPREYEVTLPGRDRQTMRIPMEQMIAFRDVDPFDPLGRGVGTGRSLSDELDTDEAAAKHVKQWFLNGARPDLIVTADGLKREDVERLEERWFQRLGGFLNRHKPFFMNRAVTVQEIGQNFKDMELSELRRFQRDLVIAVFGVPPEIIGIVNESKRSTVEAADYHFARWVVLPRAEMQRSILNRAYAQAFVRGGQAPLMLDFVSPVSEDRQFQLSAVQAMPWIASRDELREIVALEPTEDSEGDLRAIPLSFDFRRAVPDSDALDEADALAVEEEPEEPDDDEEPDDEDADIEDEDVAPTDEDEERSAKPRVKALDAGDIEAILRALRDADLSEELLPVLIEAAERMGQSAIELLGSGVSFDIQSPAMIDFARNHAGERITKIGATTRKEVRKLLLAALADGASVDQAASRLAKKFSAFRGARSHVIARTETVRAANFGNLEGLTQAGADGKEWVAVRDEDVRDQHLALDGVRVPLRSEFRSEGHGAQHPGGFGVGHLDIGCRCTTVAADLTENAAALTENRKSILWKGFEARRTPLERQSRAAIRSAFRRQEASVIAALKRRGGIR